MPHDMLLPLAEVVVPGRRLGRHINHDPRSVAYRVGRGAPPTTARWDRRIPIYDQGDLGSCTGYATVGCLGSEPYFSSLTPAQRAVLSPGLAVAIYSDATALDPFPGTYPPEDTGSDGLSVAKAAQRRGFISGYRHVLSLGEAYAAITEGPFIFGGPWMSGMDQPNSEGVVTTAGYARGGHEWLVREYDAALDLWTCDNSWGLEFGVRGSFRFDSAALAWLLARRADATPFVPVTAPAPEPAPPEVDPFAGFPFVELDRWSGRLARWWPAYQKTAADRYRTWRTEIRPQQ